MSGYKDDDKRQKVRALLVVPMWQRASDRLIARTLKVSRQLVVAVRREMIAEGTHPERNELVNTFDLATMQPTSTYDWEGYQPGSSARGGYVYDENGQIIRRSEWLRRQRQAKAKEAKKDA